MVKMSYRADKILSLTAPYAFDAFNATDLRELYRRLLMEGMHGLCFSPYGDGQRPGDRLSRDQIAHRMQIIKPYTRWVRSFSCTDGNEWIPRVAQENGIHTLVGAWLGKDAEKNEKELEGLVALAKAGMVDIAAVGNEVMYRKDLTEEALVDYMKRARELLPDHVPMGYVDAYYEFSDHPRITELCDVILANCYPFWEGCDLDYALVYMKNMYQQALAAGGGKRVIIAETGWPDKGRNLRGAVPSEVNFMKYFINTQKWSKDEEIEICYFSSFDESWKVADEGDVGACWGLWSLDEKLKFID